MAELLRCEKCRDEVHRVIKHPDTEEDWPDGLCETCDAVVRGVSTSRRKIAPEPPRQKRKYTRKTKPDEAVPIPGPGVEVEPKPTTLGMLEKIRLGYMDELRALKVKIERLELKVETANEFIEKVEAMSV